jgi:hypothetical protein
MSRPALRESRMPAVTERGKWPLGAGIGIPTPTGVLADTTIETMQPVLPDLPKLWLTVSEGINAVRSAVMEKTIRDVLGDPESCPNCRNGMCGRPVLNGATIVNAGETEPDEVRVTIEAQGQMMHSNFAVADPEVRHRVLEILRPGLELEDCLDQLLKGSPTCRVAFPELDPNKQYSSTRLGRIRDRE